MGNAGDDTLEGKRGDDTLKGGDGADEFIFNAGDGRDRVVDFDISEDTLVLNADLVGGSSTGRDVLREYATVTAAGVEFDFGGGDVIILEDLNSKTGLAGDIIIS